MKRIFQKKLLKELEGISAAVKAQVDKEKQINLQQLADIEENVTLTTLTQTMEQPQKRARPQPAMSVRNPSLGVLEESKDPLVCRASTRFA